MRRLMGRRAQAIIRYDGPALSHHEMDVHDLAPALLALGDVCKIANEVFNGSATSLQVLVRADVEQKCFQLQIQLVQTLFEQLTAILDADAIQDAKNILEWLGIFAGGTVVVGGGLFGLYKAITRDYSDGTPNIEVRAEGGSIVYHVVGDGNTIVVPAPVHKLAQDPRMFPTMKRVLGPLTKEGYDRLEFEYDGRVTQYFTRDEARKIIQTPDEAIQVRDGAELVSNIRTQVRVRKAIYDGPAKWGVVYKRGIEARIAHEEWLRDFQHARIHVPPGSSLIVDLEERVRVDEKGEQIGEPVYTILHVHGVVPPPEQMEFRVEGEG
jgi:hypothetical protein